jgi:hypothetical protein
MSRTRPKEKRRGGQRDDSNLTICLTRDELAELLERTRRRCEEYERKQEELILKRSGILIVKSNIRKITTYDDLRTLYQ